MYDVYSEFDLEMHKKTFIDYCEVAIDLRGKIHYAVPSHQGFLELAAAKAKGMSLAQYVSTCPKDMYANYLPWLIQETGYVLAWADFWMGTPNPRQQASLMKLIENGLVKNVRKRS